MDKSTSQEEPPKKGPLDNLSKDELIKKCKGLLGLAQKAKQAKDEYAEENKNLKEQLSKYETQKDADKKSIIAMKEIVDSLTENKLTLTTQIADCKTDKEKLQNQIKDMKSELDKMSEMAIENEALKRQTSRLTQENEELLTDLDNMEKRLEKVNEYGIQQQKDLMLLEKETEKWRNLEVTIQKLQEELNVAKEENKHLTAISQEMETKEVTSSKNLEETQKLHTILESSDNLIATLQKEKEELLLQNTSLSKQLESGEKGEHDYRATIEKQTNEIEELKKCEEKHIARIHLFRTKILEFAGKLKKLKKSREILIETVQEYAQSVPKWQKEILNASNHISKKLISVENEKTEFAKKIKNLEETIDVLRSQSNKDTGIQLTPIILQDLISCCDQVHLEFQEKLHEIEKLNCDVMVLRTELSEKNAENETLRLRIGEVTENLIKSESENEEKSKDIEGLQSDLNALTEKLNRSLGSSEEDSLLAENLKRELQQTAAELQAAQAEHTSRLQEIESLKQTLNEITLARDKMGVDNTDKTSEIRQLADELKILTCKYEELQKENANLTEALKSEKESRNETLQELKNEITAKSSQLQNLEQEKNNLVETLKDKNSQLERLQSALTLRESENSDFLSEMRELNEAFKGRGDVISRQQDKIKDLEAECKKTSDTLAKIEANLSEKEHQIIERETKISNINKDLISAKEDVANLSLQASEREKIIKNLSVEMSSMREKPPDAQSDVLSTSTISRVEESARLREVDDSFEEKYNKLRALAVKLKKKVQEQSNHIMKLENENRKNFEEKNEITTKLGTISVKVKNLQALQNENDKLLDEVENYKKCSLESEKHIKSLETQLNDLTTEITEMRQSSDADKKSKNSFDNTVKEYQNQIKALKQEKDSFNMVRKGLEKERDQVKSELTKKNEELNAVREQCETLRSQLEKKKSAEKQSSVLNLEIEAYEKSLNEATQKLEAKKVLVKELQDAIESKDTVIRSLNEQIKLLEENVESEKQHSGELKQQIDIQHAKFKENEHEKQDLRTQIQDKTSECEQMKASVDELQLQLSTIASDKEKLCTALQTEKDNLLRQVLSLEETIETTNTKLKAVEHELEDLRAEYASYKVKAQSVLRQNQSKESSRERELEEEVNAMQTTIESLNVQLKKSAEIIDSHEKKIEDLRHDNERVHKRCKELMQLLEESRIQYEAILEDNQKQNSEYQESLKSHRLQIETLNNCYKKQIEDLEKKHSMELEEMQKKGSNRQIDNKVASRIAPFGGPKTVDEQKIDLILMEREDAEGSETTTSTLPKRRVSTTRAKRDLVPLDELLNTPLDENQNDEERSVSPSLDLQLTKEKLSVQESRVKHLTSLLAETEQDLAKLTQLNDLLKEEVRRQERSMEREQHIHNSEYLKNVILKFITLSSGDERTRLVPVLNTILKLSPEETQALQTVAKGGEAVGRSWGSYLPIWSNHQ